MDSNPLISVILPVYNGQRYLAEAIASVLAQTYRPVEIRVIDDGSTDHSAEVATSFASSVQYFYQTNGGIGAARNRGVDLARGSFFAFLDHDDLWVQEKLAYQMAAFDRDPQLDVVFGHVIQFHSPELDEQVKDTKLCPTGKIAGYIAGTMLVRRGTFHRVGPFRTDLQLGDFIDWYAKAMEKGLKSLMLPSVLMKRRIHAANTGIRTRSSRTDYVRVLKAALDRRNAARKLGGDLS
jgi:glycosyltransferase involved in cell wall biosynthesis